jgi:sigma-B regulation protein RsbU (phosphoserine phosphatase)
MRIRWKLLILLLVVAVVPLIAVRISDVLGTLRLGYDQAGRARDDLIRRAREQLQQAVAYQATSLQREGQLVQLAVAMQAQEVERLLAAPPPAEYHALFSSDYDAGTNVPADLHPSPKHLRFTGQGEQNPIPVTYSEQVFKIAPGVSPESVRDDIARLSQMVPVYRFIHETEPDVMYWQYTSLESGVHSCYPGHGGYPDEYDPRQRDWYHYAHDAGAARWTAPYVDVSSQQVTVSAVQPVYGPGGRFAGVTAIDVLVSDIVERIETPPLITEDHRAYVVTSITDARAEAEKLDREGLLIVGRQDYSEANRDWTTPTKFEWLDADNGAEFDAMKQDILAGRPGVRRMPHDGRDCLWGYCGIGDKATAFILIVPEASVIAAALDAEREVLDRTWRAMRTTGLIFLAIVLVVVVAAFRGSRAVTRPIRQLAEAAERVARGDLEARAEITRRDELGELADAFNAMVPQLRDRLRLRESLSVAMEVQQHLLPAAPPRLDGFDIAGRSIYCDETGGDYYDFLDLTQIGPHTLGVAVGDVTGHGIAAALLMTTARALLRSHAPTPGSIAEMMNKINEHMTADTPVGRFMTLFYLVLDTQRRDARWVSAGHDAVIVYDPAREAFDEMAGEDIPLGIAESWSFHELGPRPIGRGEVFVIGTDGIWESANAAGELFGKGKLREVIRRNAARSAEEISAAIVRALAEYRAAVPQQDDVTMVVIKAVA